MSFDQREYYQKNKEGRIARAKAWNLANRDIILKRAKERLREFKGIVFNHYGQVCVCCGEKEEAFLTVDHLEKNGNVHRKQTGAGVAFYKWIVDNNFPSNLRILCMNCNYGERRKLQCPHLTNGQMGPKLP